MSATVMSPSRIVASNVSGAEKEMSAPESCSWRLCMRSVKAAGPKKLSCEETVFLDFPIGVAVHRFTSSISFSKCFMKVWSG